MHHARMIWRDAVALSTSRTISCSTDLQSVLQGRTGACCWRPVLCPAGAPVVLPVKVP